MKPSTHTYSLNNMSQENQDLITGAAIKSAFAVAVSLIGSMSIDDWIKAVTLAVLIIQGLYTLRKWWREERPKKRARYQETTAPGDL